MLNSFIGDTNNKDGYLLFDMSQIALAAVIQTVEPNQKIQPRFVRHVILNSLKYNIVKFGLQGYNKVVICIDNSSGDYWRRDIAYYYKKNRTDDRKESKFDWDGYFSAINQITTELVEYMPYIVINLPRTEADDTIGVLSEHLFLEGCLVKIISSDGDFTQLHKFSNVSQYSPAQKKDVKPKESPSMDLLTKIVKGDKKDNIASIKVRSDYLSTKVDGERQPNIYAKWLNELSLSDDIHGMLTTEESKRFKENEILIDLSKVRCDIKKDILDTFINYKVNGRSKMYSYFIKNGLSKLVGELNKF